MLVVLVVAFASFAQWLMHAALASATLYSVVSPLNASSIQTPVRLNLAVWSACLVHTQDGGTWSKDPSPASVVAAAQVSRWRPTRVLAGRTGSTMPSKQMALSPDELGVKGEIMIACPMNRSAANPCSVGAMAMGAEASSFGWRHTTGSCHGATSPSLLRPLALKQPVRTQRFPVTSAAGVDDRTTLPLDASKRSR